MKDIDQQVPNNEQVNPEPIPAPLTGREGLDLVKASTAKVEGVSLSASPEITKEWLKDMMTLEVEIKADFGEVLKQLRVDTGADLQPRPDGYHLTIVGPTEYKVLSVLDDDTISELERINEQIQKGQGITVKGIGFIDGSSNEYRLRETDAVKKTAFIAFDIPALQEFRTRAGLPPKDFHVTLGFVGGDINMRVLREEPIKPNSPKMKYITEPIPKKANSRFDGIVLPEINYGKLDGQMKQQK